MPRYLDLDHLATLPERAFQRVGGRITLEGGGKGGSAPPPPNYAPIQAASDYAANLGYQAADNDLAFRKQVYQDSIPREQQLYDLATQVAQQQMGISDENQAFARSQQQDYTNIYRPNEIQTLGDAYGMQYLSPEEQQQMFDVINGTAGLNSADSEIAMRNFSNKAESEAADTARTKSAADINSAYGQGLRELTRLGGDPNRLAAQAVSMANNAALARVGASNQARDQARGQMLGLRSGVANFGRNMPNTAGQAFGLATQAGNSATANQQTAQMASLPYAQFASGGYGSQLGAAGIGNQAALGQGQLMNQGYGLALNYAGQQASGQGAMLGGLIGAGGTLGAAWLGKRPSL